MAEIDEKGVAFPAADRGIIAKDPIDLGDVGQVDFQVTEGGVLDAQAIKGLLVLAPADIADKTGIIEPDALAPERDRRVRQRGVGELDAVQLGSVRVGHDRVHGLAVYCGIEVVNQVIDMVELDEEPGIQELSGLQAGAQAIGQRARLLGKPVLIDALIAQAEIEDRLGFGKRRLPGGGGFIGLGDIQNGSGQKSDRHETGAKIFGGRHDQSSDRSWPRPSVWGRASMKKVSPSNSGPDGFTSSSPKNCALLRARRL